MIIFILAVIIALAVIIPIMLSKKPVKMKCPHCGHEWTMSKRVYMCTPYVQRGTNALFKCTECGSEGQKSK